MKTLATDETGRRSYQLLRGSWHHNQRALEGFVRNLRRLDHQELLSGLSEYCDALGIAQPRSIEDVVDRRLRPGKRIVGPQHDLARADLGDQVASRDFNETLEKVDHLIAAAQPHGSRASE